MMKVGLCLVAVFVAGVECELLRKLSYAKMVGYEPASDVVPHSLIDLDQAEMETHLKVPDFEKAKNIYMKGAHSGATATLTIDALSTDLGKGAEVRQGAAAIGKMKKAASATSTSITVSYKSVCKEGGTATQDVSGCFTTTGGPISVNGFVIGAPSYVGNNYRTLMGFSTAAKDKMTGQVFYDVYYQYYGKVGDYAHQRVMAALNKQGICQACDDDARVEIAKKTSAYMNVWMYVVREFEDAIADCKEGCIDCNDDPVHAWDEGVAFYAGSLEGTDNANSESGKLLHALADKRCGNFKTCLGADGIDTSKGSKVNAALLTEFKNGQAKLLGGKCKEAIPIKNRIVELMSVPLVQGALRYAYKVGVQNLRNGKTVAEGAAFSAAILPRIHACDATAAKLISDNMNMELDASSLMSAPHEKVKKAFESTYKCLGITCEDVGGLWNANSYFDGAEPCGSPAATNGASPSPSPGGESSACVHLQPALFLWALLLAFVHHA